MYICARFYKDIHMCRWVKISVLFIAVLAILIVRNDFCTITWNGHTCFLHSSGAVDYLYDLSYEGEQQGEENASRCYCLDLFHCVFLSSGFSSLNCKSVLRPYLAFSDRNVPPSFFYLSQNLSHSTHPYLSGVLDYYVYTLGHILI